MLEIGTSNGVSAPWLADALRRIPGAPPLVTIEREAAKAAEARTNADRAGLADWIVDVRVGDATEVEVGRAEQGAATIAASQRGDVAQPAALAQGLAQPVGAHRQEPADLHAA